MNDQSSNSAHLSQIETYNSPRRVVLLGASNLSLSVPRVIEAARAQWRGPLEFFIAMGFGRSYGQESKFFGKKFSGILQSEIWSTLDRAPRAQSVAILADIGNDLAYEAPVESIVGWVATTLDRLAALEARVVLNNLPLESLRTIGAFRFRVFRSILFPRCRLARGELLNRAEALSGRLGELAAERKIPAFSGENAWYGLDPIHPRRGAAGEIWLRMLSALEPSGRMPAWTSPPRGDAKLLRRIHAESWSPEVLRRDAPPPSAQLADGATVKLF